MSGAICLADLATLRLLELHPIRLLVFYKDKDYACRKAVVRSAQPSKPTHMIHMHPLHQLMYEYINNYIGL